MPEADSVTVNFDDKTATITAKSDTKISRADVETTLKTAGYGVTSFEER
jgi:hypothetical protein